MSVQVRQSMVLNSSLVGRVLTRRYVLGSLLQGRNMRMWYYSLSGTLEKWLICTYKPSQTSVDICPVSWFFFSWVHSIYVHFLLLIQFGRCLLLQSNVAWQLMYWLPCFCKVSPGSLTNKKTKQNKTNGIMNHPFCAHTTEDYTIRSRSLEDFSLLHLFWPLRNQVLSRALA